MECSDCLSRRIPSRVTGGRGEARVPLGLAQIWGFSFSWLLLLAGFAISCGLIFSQRLTIFSSDRD